MNRRIPLVAAILGLSVVAEGASGVRINSNDFLSKSPNRVVEPSMPAGSGVDAKKLPFTKRATSLGFDENASDPQPPLSCLQLQIID
jgi:hypothetical protein